MADRYIIAFDQGTTSSRAIVFDHNGEIRGVDQREFRQIFPRPGWVEHDPDDIWRSQLDVARGAMRNAGIAASDLAAIGITNQRETTILWERSSGRPVANAIVWQDRRTADSCDELRAAGHEELISRKTGLVIDPYFSGTKIAWMLDHVAGLRERAERGEIAFGTVDSWLIWNLTGGKRHVTDYTNASRTLLFNLESLAWDDELLAALRVPRDVLPEPLPSTAAFGEARADLFGGAVPIGGVAGDQHAALVGQAGLTPGIAKNTYGTGSFVLLNTGSNLIRGGKQLLTTVAYSFEPKKATYALEGSIFVTGAAVQWLRDGLGIIAQSSDVEALAQEVDDAGGVYLVPAFTGLGAPYWDPHARGTIVGITRGTTRAHLARAALEAMAYQTADVIAAMETEAKIGVRELRVDGGACVIELPMEFQADLLDIPVIRPKITETTALGAAYLAGLQTGYWNGVDEIAKHWHEDRRYTPRTAGTRDERLAMWRRAIERSRAWSA